MSHRQIVLDTETTGMPVNDGHRIIEIGCIEMISRKITGKVFHCYLNPEREIDAGAFAVHGISSDFLQNQPSFKMIVDEFLAFIRDAELIIHNAPFDIGFLNDELTRVGVNYRQVTDYCQVTDTLAMARSLHMGQRNSLDALCKRYRIDASKRDLHGALLDAHLLAQVYLAMTGGQGSFFNEQHDIKQDKRDVRGQAGTQTIVFSENRPSLIVLKSDQDENKAHQQYLEAMKARGSCLWLDN